MAKVLDDAQKAHLAEHGYAVCKGVVDAATCQWPHSLLCSELSLAV